VCVCVCVVCMGGVGACVSVCGGCMGVCGCVVGVGEGGGAGGL
jgi:hypothetical protein